MPGPQFALIAGVEITGGQVGSLVHGEVDDRHTWGDPVAAAERWVAQGAPWIHVADLDAGAGSGDNHALLRRTVSAVHGRARVEVSGGIRDESSLAAALATRADRVVVDAAALVDGAWLASAFGRYGERLAAGVAAHDGGLWAPGTALDGAEVADVVRRLHVAGARSYLVTDLDARGLRKSRDRRVLLEVCAAAHGEVIAFGGIERLEDLHAVTEIASHGVHGVVVDRALYTEAFTYAEAVAAVEPRFDLFFWGPPQP